MTPMHHLTNREIRILSVILKKRYELLEKVKDDSVIDSLLFDSSTRREMEAEVKRSANVFNVVLSKLRKVGIIDENGKLNRKYIPRIDPKTLSNRTEIIFNIIEQQDGSNSR
jgi:hypothetical protein